MLFLASQNFSSERYNFKETKIQVFWYVRVCCFVATNRDLETCCLHLWGTCLEDEGSKFCRSVNICVCDIISQKTVILIV